MKLKNFERTPDQLIDEADTKMRLHEDNAHMLLSSLTHFYSDPSLAALREYFANAYDAHTDKGDYSKPIEVETYYRYNQTWNLRIRDYGKGMSEATLREIYSQYGASTKRSSNKQRGGFGLGSKSGLAVSDRFTVISIHEGERNVMEILRVTKENNQEESVIRLIDKTQTTELSGTEIILPITRQQSNSVTEKAIYHLSGYDPEHYTLNGNVNEQSVYNKNKWVPVNQSGIVLGWANIVDVEPSSIYDNKIPNLRPSSKEETEAERLLQNVKIIIGGVYYPELPSLSELKLTPEKNALLKKFNKLTQDVNSVILNVPIGSVKLPPHRDTIIDSPLTWRTLIALIEEFTEALPSSLQNYADTLSEEKVFKFILNNPANLLHQEIDNRISKWFYWFQGRKVYLESKSQYILSEKSYSKRTAAFIDETLTFGILMSNVKLGSWYIRRLADMDPTELKDNLYQIRSWRTLSGDAPYIIFVSFSEKVMERTQIDAANNNVILPASVSQYLGGTVETYLRHKFGQSTQATVVTSLDGKIDPRLAELCDEVVTIEDLKDYIRQIGGYTRKAPQDIHGVFDANQGFLRSVPVTANTHGYYFGGKDSINRENNPLASSLVLLKSRIHEESSTVLYQEMKWLGDLQDIYGNTVIVDFYKSLPKFQKTFEQLSPLAEQIVKDYRSLDELDQSAVHAAYNIVTQWKNPYRPIQELKQISSEVEDEVLQRLLQKDSLLTMGLFISSFLEPHIDSYVQFRQEFIQENSHRTDYAKRYYLIYHLIYTEYKDDRNGRNHNPKHPINIFNHDMIVEYLNKLK